MIRIHLRSIVACILLAAALGALPARWSLAQTTPDASAQGAPAHLRAGGWLVLEHGAEQAQEVRRALVAAGFGHVRSHRDLSAHERVTEGQR